MSDMADLTNPLSMFDVKGKVALITGASGAFGMVAARVLAGAGCKLVLVAGNAEALAEIAGEALAGICRPIKVSYASRSASLGATLVLAADGARGPEIDAQKTRIIERVNSYYGYRAVSRISIDQSRSPARMQGFAEPAATFEGPTPAPRPVEGVTDERLALALAAWAPISDQRPRKSDAP